MDVLTQRLDVIPKVNGERPTRLLLIKKIKTDINISFAVQKGDLTPLHTDLASKVIFMGVELIKV